MRIISGKFKGKSIKPPKTIKARPTTDFAKESLFNILNNMLDFEGLTVLDCFSGTGNISLEFVSRGAKSVTAVDITLLSYRFISTTIKQWKIDNVKVYRSDIFQFIKKHNLPYDLIFADPPYNLKRINEIPEIIIKSGLLKPSGILIVEHGNETNFTENKYFSELRTYGRVNFSFFSANKNHGK